MASFNLELPDEILRDIQTIERNADEILGGMTRAGAEKVEELVKAGIPNDWKGSDIVKCIKLTRTYKTPSDDGINTKIIISGYFTTKQTATGKRYRHPAPLVANVYEYGSSKFTKKPFFRKAFKKDVIEKAMLEAQKRLSGGILDE